ncbi:adenylyl-sulfate kinase [Kitasatospora sp. NPDC056651]|uniref:adenylyl-sulfate kinase n=1 Tax=Kitasatospora sp. NPDC056651 TaxID=3345892 RepID=UPI00368B25AB
MNDPSRSAARRTGSPGATVWLTGLPGAGKSTIALALAAQLRAEAHRTEVLDGDEMRGLISDDLGFSRADRDRNVRRVGVVAELLARNGVLALVPVVAPYARARDAVRRRHERSGTAYLEVHVAAPVEVCARRDVKGLYARQRAGLLTGLTGVDDPYEEPERPDLRLDTDRQSPAESVLALRALLTDRGLWTP